MRNLNSVMASNLEEYIVYFLTILTLIALRSVSVSRKLTLLTVVNKSIHHTHFPYISRSKYDDGVRVRIYFCCALAGYY